MLDLGAERMALIALEMGRGQTYMGWNGSSVWKMTWRSRV
jgi:hypothetical protein